MYFHIFNYEVKTRGLFVSICVTISVWSTLSSEGPVRFLAFGDDCFKHSISLNIICAPPPLVGSMSPYLIN